MFLFGQAKRTLKNIKKNFEKYIPLLFSLMKKVTKKIKAENHFREIIFRLALHATQAMSQKCLLWCIWLIRGWLTQTQRTAIPRDFLTKMILGRSSIKQTEQTVRLASTNGANHNSDSPTGPSYANNPNWGWRSWCPFWFFLDKQKEQEKYSKTI